MSEIEKRDAKETEPRSVLKITDMDPKFKYEISKIPGAEKIMLCFQCGTCTSGCPVARFSGVYRPRQIIRMTQLGLKERVLESETLWLCASCFTCTDHCPQDVKVADIMRVLKNLAVKEGYVPPVFKELASSILDTGYAYRIPELRIKKREELGLPSLPKGNPKSLAKLTERMEFKKLLEVKG
jgi:heterodisulfide reductase subunit C